MSCDVYTLSSVFFFLVLECFGNANGFPMSLEVLWKEEKKDKLIIIEGK